MAPKESVSLGEGPDWDWLESLASSKTEVLSDDVITKLIPTLTEWNPQEDDDKHKIEVMFLLTARSLKTRDKSHQMLVQENKDMARQIKRLKKQRTGDEELDKAMEDLKAAEEELDTTRKELQEMERELEVERNTKEDLETKLERANQNIEDLQNEVSNLKDELVDSKFPPHQNGGGSSLSLSTSETEGEIDERRVRELEEQLRIKNKQIHQLLEDVEQAEQDGVTYKNKVVQLRDQLQEATKEINAMTSEYASMRENADHQDLLINTLSEENSNLKTMMDEYTEERKKWELSIEGFRQQTQERVEKMKSTIEEKETTIEELRARLERTGYHQKETEDNVPQGDISILSDALRDREAKIEELQDKLELASRELQQSADLIEKMKGLSSSKRRSADDQTNKTLIQVKADLLRTQQRASDLEEELKEAVEAAEDKDAELCEAIERMRLYESGVYGLTEAVDEIRTLKQRLSGKEKYVEELVKDLNATQYRSQEIEAENAHYRKQLGIKERKKKSDGGYESAESSEKGTPTKERGGIFESHQKNKALLQVLHKEVERLEEERINLKCLNRKLAKQLGSKAAELGLEAEDLDAIHQYTEALKMRRKMSSTENTYESDIQSHENIVLLQRALEEEKLKKGEVQKEFLHVKAKADEMLEENNKLRMSMQEILDSIREQDGKSDVKIASETLEQILSILDARHLWGSFHPAMELKMRLEKAEGINSELREQLRKARIEEDKTLSQLQKLQTVNEELEAELQLFRDEGTCVIESHPQRGTECSEKSNHLTPLTIRRPSVSSVISPGGMNALGLGSSSSSGESTGKLTLQLIQVMEQLNQKEVLNRKLQEDLDALTGKLGVVRHQMGLLYEDFAKERTKWTEDKREMEKDKTSLLETVESLQAKTEEYDSHLKSLDQGEDAVKEKWADTLRKIVILKSNESIMIRRYKAIEESEQFYRKENQKLKNDLVALENTIIEKLGELNRHKETSAFKIKGLQKKLSESVSSSELEAANREFANLTASYRELLQKEQLHTLNERKIEEYELNLQNLRKERDILKEELLSSKEKLHSLDSLMKTVDITDENSPTFKNQIQSLNKQIATLELRELNEKQKADHFDSQLKLAQNQMKQVEQRNEELESKFSEVTRVNMELQKTERDLRDKLESSVSKEEFEELKRKNEELEESEHFLRIECEKLKEVSDVARNQVELFEQRDHDENTELTSMRSAILDLQSKSDEKALVGKLHREIIALQTRDNDWQKKCQIQEGRIARLEAQLYRLNKKSDDKDDLVDRTRTQCYIRCKFLYKTVQDLRRQYAGSVPLAKQEKFSKMIIALNEEKQKTNELLNLAEEKAKEAETKAEELLIKKEGLEELITTLKQGSGTSQVLEWQRRIEDLRLRDMRSRRDASNWEKEVEFLRDQTKSQCMKIEQLEEDLVKLETQMEHKQIEWETRSVDLEKLENHLDYKERKEKEDKEDLAPTVVPPDANLPLAKQLEQALSTIRTSAKTIDELRDKILNCNKVIEELQGKLRSSETMVIAKDKIINDLRLQMPATVDRAIAVASIGGRSDLSRGLNEDYETKQALEIAQSTVTSLRERLLHKEETLKWYETLLKDAREDHETEMRKKQEEIVHLQTQLKTMNRSLNDLKRNLTSSLTEQGVHSTSQVIKHQAARIQSLEDETKELQAALNDMSNKLAVTRSESDKYWRLAKTRQKELEEFRDNQTIARQMEKHHDRQEVESLKTELNNAREDYEMLHQELERTKDALSKSPSSILKSLVEKLRKDLTDKDKKIKAMSKAINELKKQLIEEAEQSYKKSRKPVASIGGPVSNIDGNREQIEDLIAVNEKLERKIKTLENNELKLYGQVKSLKEELQRKGSVIVKMKERSKSDEFGDDEKERLRENVKRLEDRLREMNQAEKPFEESTEEKKVRNASEVARWEEKKKWEHKLDVCKKKLDQANESVSKMAKTNQGLREMVNRLEREKVILNNRLNAAQKLANKKDSSEGKVEELEVENKKLREKMENAKHNDVLRGESGIESLKLKNKLLMERLTAQEKKLSILELCKEVGGASGLMEEVKKLQKSEKDLAKQNKKLDEENVKLKFELNQSNLVIPRMSECKQIIETVLKREISEELRESLKRANEIVSNVLEIASPSQSPKKSLQRSAAASSSPSLLSNKEIKSQHVEIQRLRKLNSSLMAKIEERDKRIKDLVVSVPSEDTIQAQEQPIDKPLGITPEKLREMEEDLKRKSDLLSEVKVLLKKAADRERAQLAENETLKKRVKLVLDVDPKTPSEILAKELRQTRLTVERLECEKKELQHKISVAGVT